MTKLQTMGENFVLIGEAEISKDPDKYVKTMPLGQNGWMRKNMNLCIAVTNLNKIFVNLEAGFWSEETVEKTKNETGFDERGKPKKKQNWIYNGEMVDGKWVADNIPFEKRFEQEMIDKIPYYNKIRIAIEPVKIKTHNDNGELIEIDKTDSEGNIVCKEETFLFAGDAIDYVQKHLKNKERVYVYGHTEINQYINKQGELTTNFNRFIDQIRLARKDEENQAVGTTNFYFEKDSLDKSSFNKERKYFIQGYRTYKNKDKEVIPVPITYILDFSNPKVDWEDEIIKERCEYLLDVFKKNIKRECVYSTKWRYMLFQGNKELELTERDLSDDLKKRVKLGFITKEQAIRQMRGSAVGNRITELKLVMPLGEEDKVLMDGYELTDLTPPVIENKIDAVEKTIKENKEEKEKELKEDITKSFDAMFQ